MKEDALGNRMKAYEARGLSLSYVMPGEIMIARLDGRSFHTFTRGMERPYDQGMTEAMKATMGALVKEFGATVGYTQSDEITLVWITKPRSEIIFGGRVQKIVSQTASSATAEFNDFINENKPGHSKASRRPRFDARVFTVPSQEEALNCLLWRQQDATKNAISMAAQSMYSSKQLHGKDGPAMQELMFQNGVNFNDYPPSFKRGTFGRRKTVQRFLTSDELAKLPEAYREKQIGVPVVRSNVAMLDYWIKFERESETHAQWCETLFG